MVERKGKELSMIAGKLHALDPLAVLSRGYSASFDENGKTIKKIGQVKKDSVMNIMVTDGTISAKVTSTKKKGGK